MGQLRAAVGGPAFIENKGQWREDVLYLCRLSGLDAWITKWGTAYDFFQLREKPAPARKDHSVSDKFDRRDYEVMGHGVYMRLRGSAVAPEREGQEPLEGYYNYFFIGNDPSKWATDARRFQTVWVKGVYAGIDMRYYTEGGQLRFDWVVWPGGDPKRIELMLEGDEGSYVDGAGRLLFRTRFGEVALAGAADVSGWSAGGESVCSAGCRMGCRGRVI